MKIVNEKFVEFDIKTVLEEEQDTHLLIGDKSKKHVLPTLQNSKHRDLASISCKTMSDLVNGVYENDVEKFIIIDARYPYEFEGGHIESALNLYLKDQLFEYLFKQPVQVKDNSKRLVVVFHCEFSSERGPRLMREIRERDRSINKHCYPSLNYPEIYLLEGGYKNFFESHSESCLPKAYKPMLHDDHRNDLKFFRKKSKSWELENRRTRISKSKLDFY
jgi:M-phase inducer phosphatase 2